ncbi:hypothetical protein EBU99_06395 [bacterium]|nr:hypothetical protein [bacterium]
MMRITHMLRCLSLARVIVLALALSGCLKQAGQEFLSDTSLLSLPPVGKNGGFRIIPVTAARDSDRPRVIYRCNDLQCGEAFQPSNEERDVFIPCELDKSVLQNGRVMPYLRVVGAPGQQKVIVKEAHQKACMAAKPFEKILAEGVPQTAQVSGSSGQAAGSACRAFKQDKASCELNATQGCRWTTHPSQRIGATGGECVGLYRSNERANGTENIQVLPNSQSSTQWSGLESYKAK